jgi:leucyl/phenylalanyl-tRNA--protein transferase
MPVFQLSKELVFPNPSYAEEEGILAIGGDLSIDRLLLAYVNGIFPWFTEGSDILWWSPDPRMVLFPEEFKASDSLKQLIRSKKYTFTVDR